MTAYARRPAPGAPATACAPEGRPTYHCDSAGHRVVATDEAGRVLFAFGEFGSRPGQFDTPLDVTLVAPGFSGEARRNIVWVAVADYGNRRVQLFEPDGVLVGVLDDIVAADGSGPCRLTWRAPILDIETADGGRARMHLVAHASGSPHHGAVVGADARGLREGRLH